MTSSPATRTPSGTKRAGPIVAAAAAAWLAFLAIDFLLHASLLAPWWRATGDHWLPPAELFRRIPFAYAAFALYCALLTCLVVRAIGTRPSRGAAGRLGAIAGMAFGTIAILGNYSVLDLPLSALLIWPASFLVESAAAGVVVSWVLDSERPWRRTAGVFVLALLVVIVGVLLQNAVPALRAG